jgi:hypothetical protein
MDQTWTKQHALWMFAQVALLTTYHLRSRLNPL